MRRPSFRMALLLAALLGAAVMGTKARKARTSLPGAPAPSTTWPPIADRTPPSTPAPSAPAPSLADDVPATSAPTAADLPSDGPSEVVVATAGSTEPEAAPSPAPEPPVTEVVRIPADGGGAPVTDADPGDDAVRTSTSSSGSTWTFGGEGDTDSDRSAGSPLRADNPSLDPEPEAILPAGRIDAARSASSLIAHGDEGDVPPAPEPTFGTAPDPEAAATAPVHVATPVEVEPDEALPIPHRPGHDEEGSAS